jgi:hypothetical protein
MKHVLLELQYSMQSSSSYSMQSKGFNAIKVERFWRAGRRRLKLERFITRGGNTWRLSRELERQLEAALERHVT